MDEAARRRWEKIADQCFSRAYRAAMLAASARPVNGMVPGPRARPS